MIKKKYGNWQSFSLSNTLVWRHSQLSEVNLGSQGETMNNKSGRKESLSGILRFSFYVPIFEKTDSFPENKI